MLGKKQKKALAKLIRRKMDRLGIKNEMFYVASGKKVTVPVRDEKGGFVIKDDKIETRTYDMPIARNPYKNTLRNLLKQPISVIRAFLDTPEQAQ